MQKTAGRFTRNQLLIVFLLGVLSALGPFSIDMYLPAFLSIAHGLNTSIDAVQLSLASYFIGISAGQLFYGPITDRFGRKKPLYVGMFIYTLAAIGCALAANIDQLVFFRLLQALGGCAGMVVSRAVVRDLFESHESAKVYSMLMLVMGVAPIIAPSIGGFVALTWGWRAIFGVLAGISVVTIAAIGLFLPESKLADKSVKLNVRSISKGYLAFLKNPMFIYYALCGSFASAGMFAYISSAPFVYMELFGFSEKTFGIVFSTNAAGLIFCSQVNRILLKKHTTHFLLRTSCRALMFAGILVLLSALFSADKMVTVVLIFLFVSTLGFIYPNSTALALAETGNQSGSASALFGALQMLISAISAGLISLFYTGNIFPAVGMIAVCGTLTWLMFFISKKNIRRFTGQEEAFKVIP